MPRLLVFDAEPRLSFSDKKRARAETFTKYYRVEMIFLNYILILIFISYLQSFKTNNLCQLRDSVNNNVNFI